MDKLPIEVLHRLFTLLSLSQRIKCTLVCRLWWRTLDTRSLLYDIDISHEYTYTKFIDMLERLPYRSNQVEELSLKYCLDFDFDKRKLCNMFPNARKICLINQNGVGGNDFSNKRFHCTNSKPKIEELTEYGSCELTCFLTSMNLSSHIRKLELDLGEAFRKRLNNIIAQLKNMPVLEILKLQNFIFVVEDFEKLHENVSTIKSLDLINVRIRSIEMPESVKSATSITRLSLNIMEMNSESCQTWLHYLSKKYDHLKQLLIYDFDTDELDEEYIRSTLKNDLVQFLQTNAPYLKSLCWNNIPFHLTIPEELDNIGCKLDNMDLRSNRGTTTEFESLALSNQSKHIKTLSLANININRTELLKNMEKLTSLSLTCGQKDMSDGDSYVDSDSDEEEDYDGERMVFNLSNLLMACPPTLTTLTVKKFDFKFNFSTNHTTFITNLDIDCPKIRKKLADIISTCFPKLTSLKLHGDILDDLTINLPNHNLMQVYLDSDSRRRSYDISIMDSKRTEPYFYTERIIGSDINFSGPEKDILVPIPYDELDGRPIMTLVCNAIEKMKFNSRSIKLME